MTLLTVDIGNSFVKAGFWDNATLVSGEPLRLPSDRDNSVSDWVALLTNAAHEAGLADALGRIDAVVIASVVPQITPVWHELCERWEVVPLLVTSQTDTGLPTRYQTQTTLGADRWVNAFAAHALLSPGEKDTTAAIVVDFGTATKWEAIAPGGVYLGGAIAPGVGTSSDALLSRAALLSGVPLDVPAPVPVIGNSTQTALQAGILRGGAGMTDQIIGGMMREMNVSPAHCRVWATGGLAPLIAPHCQTELTVSPHLTLNGLRLLYGRQF